MPNKGHKSITIHEDAKKLLEKESEKQDKSQAKLASKAIKEAYGQDEKEA